MGLGLRVLLDGHDAFQIAYAVGGLIAGRVIDLMGVRIGYAVSVFLWSLAALATAHVDDLLALSAACLLTALRGKRGPQESVLLLQLSQELTCLFQVFIAGGD